MIEQETILEQVQNDTTEVEETPQQAVETEQERNFKAMRERMKQIERERDEAYRYAETVKSRYETSIPQSRAPEQQLADDDIPDVGYVKRELTKMQQQMAEERRKLEMSNAELRLAAQYPDYRELLADENINMLRSLEPELMASIDANTDPYTKAISAIKAVKTFGISKQPQYEAKKAAIKETVSKPKSVNSIGISNSNSPLNNAYNFTGPMSEEERKRIHEEAQRRARGW